MSGEGASAADAGAGEGAADAEAETLFRRRDGRVAMADVDAEAVGVDD